MAAGGGPRVLIVNHAVGDFLRYRLTLALALRDVGLEVHIAVPRELGADDVRRHLFPVHVFHLCRKNTRPLAEIRSCVSLLRLYLRLRPMLVHHIGLKPALYGGIAARIAGIPGVVNLLTGLGYLFTAHSLPMRLLRPWVETGLRFTFRHQNSHVIFQNTDDRDRLLASGTVTCNRTEIIRGSGVDLSLFTAEPEPEGPVVVLMAARLLWQKGVGEFVAAARALRARGIRARFVLLGEPDPGHPSAVPLSMLQHWHKVGDVEWLGWRDDMPASIAQCHIACLPSYYGEGAPRFLIEAAAGGRPIVATDSPGCREVVRYGCNGLLVPVRDAESLAEAMAQLIENASLRATMGERSREIAINEFSLEYVIRANLAVYRLLLASIGA